jgi:hypothetical protein
MTINKASLYHIFKFTTFLSCVLLKTELYKKHNESVKSLNIATSGFWEIMKITKM